MDTRTPQERAYDALRDGSAYLRRPATLVDATTDYINCTMTEQAFDHLPDGTTIYGDIENVPKPGSRSPTVHADIGAFGLCADSHGHISGNAFGQVIEFDGVTRQQMEALRVLLNSGAVERMFDAAERWAAGA